MNLLIAILLIISIFTSSIKCSDPCQDKICPENTTCHLKNNESCKGLNCESSSIAICIPKTCTTIKCKCKGDMNLVETINSNGCPTCSCKSHTQLNQQEVDVCNLPKEQGPCRAIIGRFYYDSNTQKCLPFKYGGCHGNENNFLTLEFCQRRCVKNKQSSSSSSSSSETDLKNCFLDQVVGPCRGSFERYFYNSTSNKCETFLYGGCDGNKNNFLNEKDCKLSCNSSLINSIKKFQTPNICNLNSDVGPCRAAFRRYFFNKTSAKCEEFLYGGCDGNENNFKTLNDCNQKCTMEQKVLNDCELDADMGPCRANLERYFFNKTSQKCEKFMFGGCFGNNNNFETIEQCSSKCAKNVLAEMSSLKLIDEQKCNLNPEIGPCRASLERYFFNSTTQKCELFLYGGCNGNENNFETLNECTQNCSIKSQKQLTSNDDKKMCSLSKDVGPCKAMFKRFYYNPATKKCESFTYGGCRGNSNRFLSEQECLEKCASTNQPVQVENNKCKMKKESGLCMAHFERFYFNSETNKCEPFIYGGCGGNENNFETETKCLSECAPTKIDKCSQPKVSGPCYASFQRFFYNSTSKQCEEFIFGGCLGNENNFESKDMCQKECVQKKTGVCPKPSQTSICVTDCKTDSDCKGIQKCCNNGCGPKCMNPVN